MNLPLPAASPSLARRLGLFALSQAAWFACVLGAAAGHPALGPAVTVLALAIHLATSPERRAELSVVGFAALLGYALDSALVLAGALEFPAQAQLGGPSTVWMVSLWAGFAMTLRTAARGLIERPLLAALFGLVGGPVAYWAGVRFGAAQFGEPALRSALLVSLEWVVAMSALAWWTRRSLHPA